MQHASIVAFLSGKLSAQSLAAEIADEVATFRAALKQTKTGRIIISDGPLFVITKEGARRLLEALANEQLPFDAANYVADCIVMNDDFEFADDAVRDAVHFVEDDSGIYASGDENWRPRREEVLAAISQLD